MYARTIIIGRLGADPEMRFTPDGTPVTSFSVATDRSWADSAGQKQQRTTWYRVTAWRKLAETCAKYLGKGRLVMVEGEMVEPKPFEGRDGTWRASLDLVAARVQFLGSKGDAPAEDDTFKHDVTEGEEIPF